VLADHCSDYLFAPTERSREALLSEGIPENRIYVTGNTVVDAVFQNIKFSEEKNTLEELGIEHGNYFLCHGTQARKCGMIR